MISSRIFGIGVPMLALAMAAHASPFTFVTSPGAVETTGNPVSASAVVTTNDGGTVTVVLNNLFVNPVTVAQNLSDFSFVLSGTGFGSGTLASSSGQEVTIAADGTPTVTAAVSTGWAGSGSGGSYLLNVLGTAIGPAHTIIGAPGAGGKYTAAGGSIANNGPHNPFLNQTATFTFNISGVTAGTVVSSTIFSFGTTTGDDVSGCLVGGASCTSSTVPEPVSLSLVGGGLLALGLFRKRIVR